MRKDTHILYYLLLTGILFSGLYLIYDLSPQKDLQMMVVIGLSFIYVLLGIVHHLLSHDLVAKIVIEYVLIASLGIAAAFFIFKGGFGL